MGQGAREKWGAENGDQKQWSVISWQYIHQSFSLSVTLNLEF